MQDNTSLFRQVNPSWIQNGRITSQTFLPTPKDEKRLSVYDGGQITASGSWHHYTQELKLASIGVLAVTVAECTDLDLPVEPDPEPFPEHAVIRFDGLSKNQIKIKSKKLKEYAESHGWQFQPDENIS